MKNITNFWYSHLGFILLILLLTNCARGILVEEASEYRDELTFAELMDPEYKSSEHVHNSYFAPMGDATHALHDLEGTLTVPQVVMKIKSLKESEKEHLLNVLEKTHWDLEKTSRLLKISLQRIKSKIKEYGISRTDFQDS